MEVTRHQVQRGAAFVLPCVVVCCSVSWCVAVWCLSPAEVMLKAAAALVIAAATLNGHDTDIE